jgi:hypothetical protein
MCIYLKKDEINTLFASRAVKFLGDSEMVVAGTQMRTTIHGGAVFNVVSDDGAFYNIAICASTQTPINFSIIAGGNTHTAILPPTRGYFVSYASNFERYDMDEKIFLPKGESSIRILVDGDCAISSIELFTCDAYEKRQKDTYEFEKIRVPLGKYCHGYGLMFHWVGQSMPRKGNPMAYEDAVKGFDTVEFANIVNKTGAKFVFMTANHMYPHFPAPILSWEKNFPGMTTQRDLVFDLAHALKKYEIDLMLYINFTAAYFPKYGQKPGEEAIHAEATFSEYEQFCCEVFEEIGFRYGELIKGWWIDSCYQVHRQYIAVDFARIYMASKAGYADRITTFNYWVLPVVTKHLDYWAGEVCDIIKLPEALKYTYGCAKGIVPHVLLLMEDNWWHDKKDQIIPAPRLRSAELATFIRGMNACGGMVTINLQIYQDGGVGEESLRELMKLKDLMQSEGD